MSADLWTQRGGNAGHTSYVDVSFDPALLSEAWSQPLGYEQSGTGSWQERAVAIDQSHVYRTALEGYAPSGTYYVMAFDLQGGDEVWRRTIIGNAFEGVSAPSVADGVVYVNRAGHSGISGGSASDWPRLYGLDARTGDTVLEQTYAAQWGSNERPVIADNQLVVEDGYYGGISAYTASTLEKQWFVGRSAAYDQPFAALDEQFVYAFDNEVYRRSNGERLRNIIPPEGLNSVSQPMVSDSGLVLFNVRGGTGVHGVSAYDGTTHTPLWTQFTATPAAAKAVGNGVVAVAAGQDLIILDEADGTQIQSWRSPANLTAEIVLTQNHVFVQSVATRLARVHAIDLVTGEEVWSTEHQVSSGSAVMEMAMGGGHLLLSHHQFVRAFAFSEVNRSPVAIDGHWTTDQDTPLDASVIAMDPDGDSLTYAVVTDPTYGTLTSFSPETGEFRYIPNAGYHGPDSFTFRANDGKADSNTATVSITVAPVVLEITIDILPGDPTNQVRLDSKEIEVAILGAEIFQPLAMLDLSTLRLRAPDSTSSAGVTTHPRHGYRYELRDVNGDGILDLVVKFATSDTGLKADDTILLLEGELLPEHGGGSFVVSQGITVVDGSKGGGKGNGGGNGKKK